MTIATDINIFYLYGSSQLSTDEIDQLRLSGFNIHIREDMYSMLSLDKNIGDNYNIRVVNGSQDTLSGITIVPLDYQSVSLYKEGLVTPVGELFDQKIELLSKQLDTENTIFLVYSSSEPFYAHNIPFVSLLKEKYPSCKIVVSGNETSDEARKQLSSANIPFVGKMWYLDHVFYSSFVKNKNNFFDFSKTVPDDYKKYLPQKERKNKFLLTMRICRPHRLILARMFELNEKLLNDTIYSRNFSIDNSFLKEIEQSKDFLYMLSTLHDTVKIVLTDNTILDKDKINAVKKIFKAPVKLDLDKDLKSVATPGWMFDHAEIVLVSGGEHNINIIDEKQIIPMYFKKPFITVGGKGMYDMMKRLGFKPFDDCWDVSFDKEESFFNRTQQFYNLVVNLLNLSGIEFSRVRYKTKESIEFNYEHLVSGNFQRNSNNLFFDEVINAASN